jgi:hypothetical protein
MTDELEQRYPLAPAAANRIHSHVARHLPPGPGAPEPAVSPGIETIETLINVAFWTSLRREESFTPRISLAYVTPDQVKGPMTFARPVLFAPGTLTRLAPAVERPGIHLCVTSDDGELRVWGATSDLPPHCLVFEIVAPGFLVIKESRGDGTGKFVNLAVLQGDELKVTDGTGLVGSDCPELLTTLLGIETDNHSGPALNVLIQLAVSMREHGRGGSLLVVQPQTEDWQRSILQPMNYAVSPAFAAIENLVKEDPAEKMRRRWLEALGRVVDAIAGLTAVDGATIINYNYELLGFGAKIVRREGFERVTQVIVTEPIEGTEALITEPAQLGGTRHLSAAQFAHDQRDAIALVASQDGRFTVFGWSQCEQMVHAHRLETLLL